MDVKVIYLDINGVTTALRIVIDWKIYCSKSLDETPKIICLNLFLETWLLLKSGFTSHIPIIQCTRPQGLQSSRAQRRKGSAPNSLQGKVGKGVGTGTRPALDVPSNDHLSVDATRTAILHHPLRRFKCVQHRVCVYIAQSSKRDVIDPIKFTASHLSYNTLYLDKPNLYPALLCSLDLLPS